MSTKIRYDLRAAVFVFGHSGVVTERFFFFIAVPLLKNDGGRDSAVFVHTTVYSDFYHRRVKKNRLVEIDCRARRPAGRQTHSRAIIAHNYATRAQTTLIHFFIRIHYRYNECRRHF